MNQYFGDDSSFDNDFNSSLNDNSANSGTLPDGPLFDPPLSSHLSSNNTSTNDAKQAPAVRVPLTGQYLIEASAGTGKTWTLTGIVLRLLIEAKRAPEHIIATTFTRAAAAEMRERIHARLVDFYQVLQWLNKLQANPDTHPILYPQLDGKVKNLQTKTAANKKDTASQDSKPLNSKSSNLTSSDAKAALKKVSVEQKQARLQWLEQQAKLAGNADVVTDPINSHLIEYLLNHTEDYPLADAMRRCALVLTTLDKLFVGTLDSLSQKWLSEYSAETGHQQGMQISDEEQTVIESIIHDAVRAFHSHIYYKRPEIYQLLQHTKRLTTPADHLHIAQKSLQFISTPIDEVERDKAVDFAAYKQALEQFKNCDLKDIEPYFSADYRKAQGFNARSKLATRMQSITTIQAAVRQYGITFFFNLDDAALDFYDAVPDAFLSKYEGGKGFNNKKEPERLAFINLESIQALKTLHDYSEQIELYLDALIENLNRNIALKVRQKLPAVLEERRETTFALQMVRLNQALSGKQGERLARYIRHHYPIALIDESQDINGEQARMIERIYLSKSKDANGINKESNNKDSSRGFLLLVGDPKQAIYGFRGGDVANYNAMKARFDSRHRMSLNVNRRSNEALINALNHWFGQPKAEDSIDKNDNNENSSAQIASQAPSPENPQMSNHLAQLGKDIYYQHITAANTSTRVSWQHLESVAESSTSSKIDSRVPDILPNNPVSIIHQPYNKEAKYNAYELTALHIAALLASGQTIEGRPLKPNDVGVLGRRKHELKQVEEMLAKLGVPTLETAENNVFDTPIAADLAALLEAMLRPHRRDIINRVLTSRFYQLSLNDVQTLMQSADEDIELGRDEQKDVAQTRLKRHYQDFQNYLKVAANHWQHHGILSALHYLFGRNPMAGQKEQQSIWVALADLEEGARYLMDLRHLMDILAQHGMHIGEYELLAWYKKNMHTKRTPEWAQQQPLPTESGVQLMTIHKSKGLEFPVVYVIGMDGASAKADSRNKHNLFLYDYAIDNSDASKDSYVDRNSPTERRLSASKGKSVKSAKGEPSTDYYAQFETIENYEELKRLGYVAFTRASEQLYMVLGDAYNSKDAERKPSLRWLGMEDKEYKFTLPERLHKHVGWLAYNTVETNSEAILEASKQAKAIDNNVESDSINMPRIDYRDAYAQIQNSYFKGWAKTSFTALSRQLSEQGKALAVFDDGVEDDLDLTDGLDLISTAIPERLADDNNSSSDAASNDNSNKLATKLITSDDIRFRFVKGANAGTFLHQIFEKIDFNNDSKWSTIIDQGIRQYQLPISYTSAANQQRLLQGKIPNTNDSNVMAIDNDSDSADNLETNNQLGLSHKELTGWVTDVLAAPLSASGQPLQAIAPKQRIAELSFNMGLAADFTPEAINNIFKQYLPDDPDKHIQLSAQHSNHIYRYLRGEIDLVYEHAGKYYVVDYKSNYLGNSLSSYNYEGLNKAMSKAGYWLQAAIYQVALHRFLRLRLHDYEGNEAQYLGAVEYLFLRGIDTQDSDNDDSSLSLNYGRIQWDVPIDLLKALDDMFGTPNTVR